MWSFQFVLLLLLQAGLGCLSQTPVPWFAGAASRSVVPPVNGRTDYFQPSPDPLDSSSPGFPVPKFDHGNIAVGNGHFSGKWVRDDLRASVLCIRHGPRALESDRETLVLVSVDVYMMFRQDIQAIYDIVEKKLDPEEYKLLRWSVSATHNHHGPDTAGMGLPVNHDHYQWMVEQIAAAVLEAYSGMQEVKLEYGRRARWMFGLGDGKDPRIIDPELHVLQAKLKTGRPLATLVQWACHPETTLSYSPKTPDEDCKKIGEEPGCSSKGRYLSSDFPGHLRTTLQEAYGNDHTLLYMNGAIGVQIGPHGPVWEVSSEFPITGDGSQAPPGAPMIEKNFRRTWMIGTQLGKAVLDVLENRNQHLRSFPESPNYQFRHQHREFLFQGTNLKFRMAMSPASVIGGDPNIPAIMGHRLRRGFVCEPLNLEERVEILQMAVEDRPLGWSQGMKCLDDEFEVDYHYNPKFVLLLPARKANWLKTEVNLIDFGWINPDGSARGRPELRILSIPAELCPEMVSGVPEDFDDPSNVSKYYKDPNHHVIGREYEFPGFLQAMMNCNKTCLSADSDSKGHRGETCTHCWFFGLTQDELGYVFPISDWRIGCLDSFNETFCSNAGLTYPGDSMSGEACAVLIPYGKLESDEELQHVLSLLKQRIPDDGDDSQSIRLFSQPAQELSFPISERLFRSLRPENLSVQRWNAQLEVCKWGQFGQAKGHYEETNAAGWGLNEVYLEEVGHLLGGVNPFGRYSLPEDP